jgi:uncharacterized lipoprotein YddW (UPF0748 family)
MRSIELSEETISALQTQAAAQGMSLQAWFEKLAKGPSANRRYTLNELMQQCDTQAPTGDDTRAWLDDGPVGREAL